MEEEEEEEETYNRYYFCPVVTVRSWVVKFSTKDECKNCSFSFPFSHPLSPPSICVCVCLNCACILWYCLIWDINMGRGAALVYRWLHRWRRLLPIKLIVPRWLPLLWWLSALSLSLSLSLDASNIISRWLLKRFLFVDTRTLSGWWAKRHWCGGPSPFLFSLWFSLLFFIFLILLVAGRRDTFKMFAVAE